MLGDVAAEKAGHENPDSKQRIAAKKRPAKLYHRAVEITDEIANYYRISLGNIDVIR